MPIIAVTDLSNQEFLNQYAAPGRVGLAGGSSLIERTIRPMQRSLSEAREKSLAREGALYCSAMVQHCYAKAGIELVFGVMIKNTTPEDLARTPVPHTAYVLRR
jgi:hypothetical protein